MRTPMNIPTSSDSARPVLRTANERVAAAYWQHKQRALQSFLRQADGNLIHNHGGLGEYDRQLLQAAPFERESKLLDEMHRLERSQSEHLLSLLGELGSEARILDAGCGRGGTSLAAHQRFGCWIDGVDIATYQMDFASRLAAESGCADRVRFHYRNMVDTDFPTENFERVIVNEATMYVDLDEAFAEFARVLKPNGAMVLFTWCRNDALASTCPQAAVIDANYVCRTHQRSDYFRALAAHGLFPRIVSDLTKAALSYFELRRQMRTFGSEEGADEAFRTGYQNNLLQYIAIVADRIPKGIRPDSQA